MFSSASEDRCVFEDIMYFKLSLYLVTVGYYCNSHTSTTLQKEYYKVNVREGVEGEKKNLLL